MKHKQLFFILLISFLSINIYGQSQFDIDAQVRPRFEHRNGYKLLPVKDADAANFISQRTRLIFAYSQDKLKFKVSLNNVRVWGDVSTLSKDDNAIAFHEAWAEAFFSNNFSVRLGRQEIVYDDHRIFGSVNWAQQGRSHDAMILKFKLSDVSNLDFGFALNANGETLSKTAYTTQYKAFQYAHYNNKFGKFGLGLLLLNNGVEYTNSDSELETDYSQTIGGRLTFKEGKFSADASTYFQTGKISDTDVKANNYALNLKYKVLPELTIGAGYECLSGKDKDDTSTDINSFNPLYGTNHKFNGWMDYFYVGNWTSNTSVGLKDLNFVVSYKKDKFNAAIIPHFFSAAGETESLGYDQKLGTEIDITVGYKVAKNIGLSAGISFMSGTDTLEYLQGGTRDDNGTFAYVQFVFNPKLFTTKKK